MTQPGLIFYRGFAMGTTWAVAVLAGTKAPLIFLFIAMITIWVELEYWAKRRAKQGGEG